MQGLVHLQSVAEGAPGVPLEVTLTRACSHCLLG